MQNIYLVCGVPGSGKSWLCNQLVDQYEYVPHDNHLQMDYAKALIDMAKKSDKPILADCPFAERLLIADLKLENAAVTPLFVIEHAEVLATRYKQSRQREIPPGHLTRNSGLQARAEEWGSFYGNSQTVLTYLRGLTFIKL